MKAVPQLIVRSLSGRQLTGRLSIGPLTVPCALGRSGTKVRKREGDGATPVGIFPLRYAFYRPDRGLRPATGLRLRPIAVDDGWCDAPADRRYNRPVRHPIAASAERLWRDDHLYDVIIVIGYNDRPRVRGAGSAIFLHIARDGLARDGLAPTEGCIAVSAGSLKKILPHLRPSTRLRVCT